MSDVTPPTVVLVEDDDLLRPMFEGFLQDAGFRVLIARSGQEALDHLKDETVTPVALVTDIRLGPGLSGWEVATQARERYSGLPVVYMTGDSAADWSAHGVPESVLIQKPFVPPQLVTAVSSLINQATMSTLPPPD